MSLGGRGTFVHQARKPQEPFALLTSDFREAKRGRLRVNRNQSPTLVDTRADADYVVLSREKNQKFRNHSLY